MKKTIPMLVAFFVVTFSVIFSSLSVHAEISPTAATFTHHQNFDESTTNNGIYTRAPKPKTTTSATNPANPSDQSTNNGKNNKNTDKDDIIGNTTVINGKTYLADKSKNIVGAIGEVETDKSGNIITSKNVVVSDKSEESPNTHATKFTGFIFLFSLLFVAGVAMYSVKEKKSPLNK